MANLTENSYNLTLDEGRLEEINVSLESHVTTLGKLADVTGLMGGVGFLDYNLIKHDLYISNENENNSSLDTWQKSKDKLKEIRVDLNEYAKVLKTGIENLLNRLVQLREISDKLDNDVTNKPLIKINSFKKYTIDGKFLPTELRPMLIHMQNVMDFYDKVLVPYLNSVAKVIKNIPIDTQWSEELEVDFSSFHATKWMRGNIKIEEDERFKNDDELYRGVVVHGNRAMYFTGPKAIKEEQILNWNSMLKNILGFKLKFYQVPELKLLDKNKNEHKTSSRSNITQRLGVLIGTVKKLHGRNTYDSILSDSITNIERTAEGIKNKLDNLVVSEKENQSIVKKSSDIIKSLTRLLSTGTNLCMDYNNLLAGLVRQIAALSFIVDLELKTYDTEIKKPTKEE